VGRVPKRAGLSAAGALLGALAAGACSGSPPQLALDLARRAPVAEWSTPWDVLRLGTPQAESRQALGLRAETLAPHADAAAAAEREVELVLRWPEPAPRSALLDLAPSAGLSGQAVRVHLNGAEIASLALAEGRRRYRLELPVEVQRPRANSLRLAFERVDERGVAAQLFGLLIGPALDARLAELAAPGAPPPLSVGSSEGAPEIVQAAPSTLRFAFVAPERAELRFQPELRGNPADAPVTFSVRLEAGAGQERELWRHTLTLRSAPPGEQRLPLGVAAGTPVRLSLRVEAERCAWGRWRAPRLMGSQTADLLAPAPTATDDEGRAGPLRRALADSNVLLLVFDAASARRSSGYGHSQRTTPELDALAAEGVTFERAYTPAVFTRAAMASLWTSRYPEQGLGREDLRLAADRLTLAELLTANGIGTAGWVANPNAGVAAGLERGFAEFHAVYSQPGRPGGAVRADAVSAEVARWLAARGAQRFFAYAHFREPHFPYDPPPPFDTLFGPDGPLPRHAREDKSWTIRVSLGRQQATPEELAHLRRLYDGNLAYVDSQIGELRRALERAGLWERTLVIVCADHGEELLEHGFIGHNEQVYQETAWIPLVMRFPRGAAPAGLRVQALADLVDLAPTIADVFGMMGRGGSAAAFRGRSLLPSVFGAAGKHATVSRSIAKRPAYALTDGRYKFVFDVRRGAQELYDLSKDPREQDDLGEREPLRLAAYREALHHFMLEHAGGSAGAGPARPLSSEELDQLKALGYLN
jgi:arylsulfatase A-like enzyme